mgnify:CR=1 FL=1
MVDVLVRADLPIGSTDARSAGCLCFIQGYCGYKVDGSDDEYRFVVSTRCPIHVVQLRGFVDCSVVLRTPVG